MNQTITLHNIRFTIKFNGEEYWVFNPDTTEEIALVETEEEAYEAINQWLDDASALCESMGMN